MNPDLAPGALAKPPRGEHRLSQLADRRAHKAAEDKVMAEAKRRDRNQCRWPGCTFKGLHVDCAHLEHRKMGGDRSMETTQRHKLIALCVRHHDQFDGRSGPPIDLEPVDPVRGTDGPVAYFETNPETGVLVHVFTEPINYVSEPRGL